jgi:hypothetical protein
MRDYVVPLRLALPLQDGGGVERRGASQLLMRGRRRRRRRDEGVPALAGEESRLDVVHRGGVRPPTETAEEEAGVYLRGRDLRWRSLRKRGRNGLFGHWQIAGSGPLEAQKLLLYLLPLLDRENQTKIVFIRSAFRR